MKKILHLGILFVALVSVDARAQYTLDFGQTNSLKSLFDLGLRPRNVFGLERDKCEVRDVDFELLLNGKAIQFSAERAEFEITKDNSISAAELISPNLDLGEAQQQAKRIFASVGSLPAGLNEAFKKAETQKSFEPLREIGIRATSGEPELRIYFIPGDFVSTAPQEKHIRIVASAYWKSKAQDQRLLRQEPIKPPLGYQNESMAPLLSPNQERLIREREKLGATAMASPSATLPIRSLTPLPTATPASSVVEKASHDFPVIVAILAILIAATTVLLLRRGQQRN
jgi:hypothetical protein